MDIDGMFGLLRQQPPSVFYVPKRLDRQNTDQFPWEWLSANVPVLAATGLEHQGRVPVGQVTGCSPFGHSDRMLVRTPALRPATPAEVRQALRQQPKAGWTLMPAALMPTGILKLAQGPGLDPAAATVHALMEKFGTSFINYNEDWARTVLDRYPGLPQVYARVREEWAALVAAQTAAIHRQLG